MKKHWLLIVLSLLTCSASSGAYASPPTAKIPMGIHAVKVVAKGYKYEMPDTMPAGPILFKFTNNGVQLHHMTIVKFLDGKTLANFASLPPGPFPKWVEFWGGPNTPMPHGGKDEDIVDLKPGHYTALCLIPGPDGKPHFLHGMHKAFVVTPARKAGPNPTSDLTLTQVDYAFHFSMPPTVGHHAIRIVNRGTQVHEAMFFKLQPGKTGQDILAWVEDGMKGPPPGAPVGGISGQSPGHINYLPINFKHGHYAILCFLPAKGGKMHADLGMIYNFKV